jgi:hypothetical protein
MLLGGVIMIIGTIISVTAFGPGSPIGNVGGFVQFFVGRVGVPSEFSSKAVVDVIPGDDRCWKRNEHRYYPILGRRDLKGTQ